MNKEEERKILDNTVQQLAQIIHKKRSDNHNRFTFVVYNQEDFNNLEQFARDNDTNMSSLITRALHIAATMVQVSNAPQKQIEQYMEPEQPKAPRLDDPDDVWRDYILSCEDREEYEIKIDSRVNEIVDICNKTRLGLRRSGRVFR